jgi:GT2 family glycosyltransferase
MALKVLLTVPNTGTMHSSVANVLLKLASETRVALHTWDPTQTQWRPYASGLNHIARSVVDEGFEFWINIDSDNPPRRNPVDLVLLDKDVIGCPTPVWLGDTENHDRPYFWSAFDWSDDHQKFIPHRGAYDGLQQVDAVGTGCLVIARRVLEAVKAPFMREFDEHGRATLGNDMAFCRRVTAAGFKVWTHYGYPCEHFKTMPVSEPITAIAKVLAKGVC